MFYVNYFIELECMKRGIVPDLYRSSLLCYCSFVICSSYTVYIYTYIQKWFFISQVLSVPTHLVLSDVDQLDTILDMEKDELAPEIEEEEVRQYRL